MNEETNVIEEQDAPIDEGTGEGISDADLDAMWADDDGDDFVEQDAEEVADQPVEEQPETQGETQPAEAEAEATDADQYLELKHLDEVKKVTKDEAKVLAQKGMDYDRIRGKLNEAETNNKKLQEYADFLTEIKGDFATVEDLMADTRARMLSEKEKISYDEAKAKLAAQADQQKAKQDAAPSRDEILESIRQESYKEMLKAYPDVKPADIPKEVWDDMQTTNSLVASYAKYEAKKLAEENKVLKQNSKNKARSTGSMKTSGNTGYTDEIDEMWYSDDD